MTSLGPAIEMYEDENGKIEIRAVKGSWFEKQMEEHRKDYETWPQWMKDMTEEYCRRKAIEARED